MRRAPSSGDRSDSERLVLGGRPALIAATAATAASAGDLLLLYVAAGGDPAWLIAGHYLGVLFIPLYAAGYWSVSRLLDCPSIFWVGLYAAAVGAAIHGVTSLAILATPASGVADPLARLAPSLGYVLPLWLVVGALTLVGSWLQFRAVRGSSTCPPWFAWTNPLVLTLVIAVVSLPFPPLARYGVPAAPNLAHVLYFLIAASVIPLGRRV